MIKKSLVVSLIFGFNALIQLINQIVVTRIFGAQLNLEIFLAAVAIPTIIVSAIFATLNDAFLPIYGQAKNKDKNKADQLLLTNAITLVVLFTGISIMLVLAAYPLSQLFYAARGVEFVGNVAFQMRYLFLALPLAVATTLFGSYLYANKKFYRFPIGQLAGNLSLPILTLLLYKNLGIWSLVMAFTVSLIIQLLIVLPYHKLKLSHLRFDLANSRPLLFNWLPLVLSYFLFRSDNLIIRSMASFLPQGYFVYLNLASKIFILATGITTIGLQITLLPHLVDYLTDKKQLARGLKLVKKAKLLSLMATAGVALSGLILGPVFIRLLFIGGRFSAADAQTTISLIPWFVLPAIGWGSYPIFFQPLMALRRNWSLLIISIISLGLAWALSLLVNHLVGPLPAISIGLTTLLSTGIILSEVVWQKQKQRLIKINS